MRSKPILLALLALFVATILGLSLSSHRRPTSGLVAGQLRPCPTTPNCASSTCSDGEHWVESLAIYGDPQSEFERLVGLAQALPRTELLQLGEVYAHFEVVTRLLRFRGDVELHLDRSGSQIHMRSASRVGHSDLGANREFLEHLRALFRGRDHPNS